MGEFRMEAVEGRVMFTAFDAVALATLPAGGFARTVVPDGIGAVYVSVASGSGESYGAVYRVPAAGGAATRVAGLGGAASREPRVMAADAAGDVFGVMTVDQTTGHDVIFKIAAGDHALSTVADVTGGGVVGDQLAADGAGDLFGVAAGGTNNVGFVFEVLAGTHGVQTLATFDGTNGAFPVSLVRDSAGNLFGTTDGPLVVNGPAPSGATFFEIPAAGGGLVTLHTFDETLFLAPYAPFGALAVDAGGNVYGEAIASSGDGKVGYKSFVRTAAGAFTIADDGGGNPSDGSTTGSPVAGPGGDFIYRVNSTYSGSVARQSLVWGGLSAGGVSGSAPLAVGFDTPPAFDGQGRLYAVGGQALYAMNVPPTGGPDARVKGIVADATSITATTGEALTAIKLTLVDAAGQPVRSAGGTLVELSDTSEPLATSTLPSGARLVDTTHGVATFEGLRFAASGRYTLTFGVVGTGVRSQSVTVTVVDPSGPPVTPAAADHLKFERAIADGTAGERLPVIRVSFRDAKGRVLKGRKGVVTIRGAAGGAALYGTLKAPLLNGVATFRDVVGRQFGSCAVVATLSGLTGVEAESNGFIIRAAAAAHLAFAHQPTRVAHGVAFGAAVWLSDRFHNGTVGRVQLTVQPAGGGTVTTSSALTGGNGIGMFDGLRIDKPGWYTLVARHGNVVARSVAIHVV